MIPQLHQGHISLKSDEYTNFVLPRTFRKLTHVVCKCEEGLSKEKVERIMLLQITLKLLSLALVAPAVVRICDAILAFNVL